MKPKSSSFDRLVARYYPAVYSFATRWMILVSRLHSRGKHSTAHANNCKECVARPRSRRSWSLQFCVRDLRPPNLSCGISNICVALSNLVSAQFHKENIGNPLRPQLFVE